MRSRMIALAAIVVVVILGAGAYVAREAATRHGDDPVVATAPRGESALGSSPRIVFRNASLGSSNGLVSWVPLDDPSGPRHVVGPACDRVYASTTEMACLSTHRGIATTFGGQVTSAAGAVKSSWPLPGIPSRVRLSPSGRLVADTSFVTGHSYMQVGFSTATVIRQVGGKSYGNLEKFALLIHGHRVTARDRNIWGVTFADDHTFYATASTGGKTYLVRGDLSARTLTALHQNAECPSVSPDDTLVAYKKRVPAGSSHWSLAVLDLASGRETVLGERRSVDDQVEWLDKSTLLYGLPRPAETGVTDVWRIGIRAHDKPQLLIKNAWSPSVVSGG